MKNNILLTKKIIKKNCQNTPTEIFELFFSEEMKKYIIDASTENNLNISMTDFNTFIGIVLLTSYNIRHNQFDYWSKDPLLKCEVVSSAMSRTKFLNIKFKLNYWKQNDQDDRNQGDKIWRVRKIIDIFRNNIQQFGFFATVISVDEMMVRFFGRTNLKQYIPNKPDKFGFKFWALCSFDRYLLDLDIYCGKNSKKDDDKLSSCALSSRVVLQMVNNLMMIKPKKKLDQYHLYVDNYFTGPDLFVHLKKLGLKVTGTLRKNRIDKEHKIDKKQPKGSFLVHHDKNSGLNYISVMDSKPVSLLSTAAGVTPMKTVKRYSATVHGKIELNFHWLFQFTTNSWVASIYKTIDAKK